MLTDSPMHFASAVACIANGGNYSSPTLDIIDTEDNQIISKSTANKLKQYMRYVVTNGTGINAEYNNNSAGKTATAQSGIYNDGKEVLNTWFAGFYPYTNPKYAIVVMREDGTSGAGDCCPIFRSIVEKLDTL
jgi:cell division protein FtsI/penicillin-binding protein 2